MYLKHRSVSRTQGSVSKKQDIREVWLGGVSRKQEAYAEGVEFAVLPELLALVPVRVRCDLQCLLTHTQIVSNVAHTPSLQILSNLTHTPTLES